MHIFKINFVNTLSVKTKTYCAGSRRGCIQKYVTNVWMSQYLRGVCNAYVCIIAASY